MAFPDIMCYSGQRADVKIQTLVIFPDTGQHTINHRMIHAKLSETEETTRDFLIDPSVFNSLTLDELLILAKHMNYIH